MNNSIPALFNKLLVKRLTHNFRKAIDIVAVPGPVRPTGKEILVKNKYVGINAADIKIAGGYASGSESLPSEIGFEGVGEIVDVGEKVGELKTGQAVMYMKMGAFSEYMYISEREAIPIPSSTPDFLPLLVDGTTASLSLDKCGMIIPGDKVLVTSASGATGHIAVQWAKHSGCYVFGTCSSDSKVKYLKSIGCDRPINFKNESLCDVLKEECPSGLNVALDSSDSEMLETLSQHLAIKGRLVILNTVSKYSKETIPNNTIKDLTSKLTAHSAMLSGFFLNHFIKDVPHYVSNLVRLIHEQKLKTCIDDGSSLGKSFRGLEDISHALEYLHHEKNTGKVIVKL